MAAAPGKSCGACTMCCSALEIAAFQEAGRPVMRELPPWRRLCDLRRAPEVCRDFECEWLTRRDLPRQLRPDLVGTILMEDGDSDEYRAVCAPEKPMAWRHPRVFAHLVAVAKSGADGGRQGRTDVLADLRSRRMGTDRLTGRPIFRQIAYWQGAAAVVTAFLTSWRAPVARSAIRCY